MRKLFLSFVTLMLVSGSLLSQELVLKSSELNMGKRPKGQFTSYESKDGSLYSVGDKITIGVPSSNKTFAFITQGDGLLIPLTQLSVSASGEQVEIKRVFVTGFKRSGFSVAIRCRAPLGLSNYNIQLENAISVGEVKSFGMTSDEALTELKKAKDKLDLELITKEEYEIIKADLRNYIK